MNVPRRIYVSMPADVWLTDAQNDMKWAVVERIEQRGYIPEIFTDPTGRTSLSAGLSWSANDADEIARQCQGAVIIGLPRWRFSSPNGDVYLPTEYCHYESAIARTLRLPLLVLVQHNLMRRVVFDYHFGSFIGEFPEGSDRTWLDTKRFEVAFGHWTAKLAQRRDLFLGYSSASEVAAHKLRDFLENDIGASVLDWQRDFVSGRSILDQIEEALTRCSAAVFLFGKDDVLQDANGVQIAAPRDNVVFEAGFFSSVRGKKRVLIVLQKGAKMLSDLGGDIYAQFDDPSDLSPIEKDVRRFIANL